MTPKVHYLELLPHEFRARLAQRPVGYLPLGTLEWHGEQNPLGSDALISRGLFERAAHELGGIVFPPLFLGPDRARLEPDGRVLHGMDYATVTTPPRQLDGSCYWVSRGLFLQLCEAVLAQAARAGFRCIVADGHGPSRTAWGEYANDWEAQFGLRLVSVFRDLKEVWCSQIDHAARNETSLMMALHPALVDLSQLPTDRSVWPQGVGGEDPRDATAAHGDACLSTCIAALRDHLAALGV
ncbi:MAG: creatininase family protein [Candidatus Latescibacteria bacterium]|nr:creatininase family protein [Candidatus Latescibacterota bacterium]